ncbi:hypothetical protein SAMN04488020_10232 [Palleronia marisminoris]|uniref:Uncharacterized protein n=1 Tax=Palleronia marisminoris TaxID=315423 RepID=A0A1Y5S163_9RHOB|nr:hypothetical protein [Palleronia marisminoris]SFG37285.1 hypothetical protein SAMN04488020_10232 [Palleronia marisminoris]SLN29983.1 hypothetical protein PAM7066_01249 [Palleronia marisminoris]
MSDFKNRVSEIWTRLNPSEPGVAYLSKLMAFMIGAFIIGLVLGHF